ncbi:fungal trichothecene efflux pump [Clohesyomyces aquaticus]|uniref:Fungal trichothecene efflux pump n=1 Tax=Clohesyomyces aquaticus TaxID=1231657 RepID=A0A1Y1Z9T5_9PLEO|nr:fungal trichothecene efflux pump [Clohesyomyces aquaticus]
MTPTQDAISAAGKNDVELSHVEHVQNESSEVSIDQIGFVAEEDEMPPGYFRSSFFLGSMMAIGFGLFGGTAGFKFSATVLATINAELGPDPNYVWIALVYTLTSAVALLIIGRVSDIFGRRWVFIGGAACGTVGSIVCATAQTVPSFIGGMVIIGIGAATQLSYYYVIGELLPMKYRLAGNGFCYIFAIPAGFGPAISRAFVLYQPKVGWRGPYYVLIAINALALVCWVVFYHPPTFEMKHRGESKIDYVKKFDYVGTVLYTGGALLFMMGLNWGGGIHPWSSAHVIATIVIGFLALVAFVLWESFMKLREPLMPVNLFTNRAWNLATIITGVGASMFYAFAVVWPRMVAELYTVPGKTMDAALIASLQSLAITTGEIIGGFGARKIGYVKWQIFTTLSIAGVLFATMATCTTESRTRAACLMWFGNVAVGWAEGLAITAVTLTARNQAELGTASGTAGSIRFLISSIASTIYNVVLSNKLAKNTASLVPPALAAAGLPTSSIKSFILALPTKKFTKVPGVTAEVIKAGLAAYKEANVQSFRVVFLTTIAFTGLAVLLSLFLPDIDKLLTTKVAVTLGKNEKVADEKLGA